jgi:uncharacterized membrane protein
MILFLTGQPNNFYIRQKKVVHYLKRKIMKPKSFLITLLFCSFTGIIYSQRISKDSLIQDIRQLSDILETSHPDPYIRGGGKIAFHERLHKLMISIPDSGMTKSKF